MLYKIIMFLFLFSCVKVNDLVMQRTAHTDFADSKHQYQYEKRDKVFQSVRISCLLFIEIFD